MTDKSELFDHLLDQIQLTDEDILATLAGASIEQVEVDPNRETWHFFVTLKQLIHPDVYLILSSHIQTAFKHIAQTELSIHFTECDITDQVRLDYWLTLLKDLGQDHAFFRSLANANHQVAATTIRVGLASQQLVEQVNDKYAPLFVQKMKQMGMLDCAFHFYVDEAVSQGAVQQLKARSEAEATQAQLLFEQVTAQKAQAGQIAKAQGEVPQIGKDISTGPTCSILEVLDQPNNQIIEGYVFASEIKEFRNGNEMLILKVTDYTSSITAKITSNRQIKHESLAQFKKGDWVRMEGNVKPDNFTSEMDFFPRSIRKISHTSRQDTATDKRVELHLHSNMSQMDATNTVSDLFKQAAAWGHKAVAITDHGGAQAFPEAYAAAKQYGIKAIYGVEASVVNDGEPVAYNPQPIPLAHATFVIFDVETTGLSSVYDRIIELAAVKMVDGHVIDTFEAFINPGHPLSSFTTELTGITDSMLEDAPSEPQVMQDFFAFSKDTILVAHNASFDMGFLNQAYIRTGMAETFQPVIDTLELSRTVNPNRASHRLNVLAKHYNITLEQHHRAVYDSETTGYILMKLLEQAETMFNMTQHDQLNQQIGQGDSYKNARPFHVTLLAKNQAGLKDLFKIVSESNVKYYHREPRVPRSLLKRYRENLLIGTGCANGEVFTAMMQKGYEEAEKLIDMYDYIELQPKSVYGPLIEQELIRNEADLEQIMKEMIRLGQAHQKLVVATGNVHYLDEKDAIYREILLKSLKANANRQLYLPPVHFRTTNEMLEEFDFLGEDLARELVITNPNQIADRIEEVEVIKSKLYTPIIEGSDDEIRRLSFEKAHQLYGSPLPEIVEARLEKELKSIISNGFSVIYLISQKLVHKSNEDGYLVGSRGSVGSSLVATMTGITEVNPLVPHYYCPACQFSEFITDGSIGSGYDLPDQVCPKCGHALAKDGQDIPFETFLGFYGDKVPDIDLNFSGAYQPRAHAYTKVLFGEDYVYRAGTISTVAERTAFGYVKGYLEVENKQVPQAEKERLAKGIEGVKRTTGQHPGGIIVIPSYMDVFDFTPIQYPADDVAAEWRTTHFDFHSIHDNILKLDILGHDDPTVIRMLQDLSGIDPKTIPPTDPEVMKIFSSPEVLGVTPEQIFSNTGTLGIPEFGTSFVRQMLEESKPATFAELLQISGLSHGTDVWLGNAQELIKNNIVPLSKVIGCRDDIMVTLIYYGLEDGLAFKIMESVRKGKGIPEEWQAEMRKCKVPEWYIDSCLKIKYMFPKAHAAAYVMMALRVAYFKVHDPIKYYAAYFSVRAMDFDIVAMHQGKEMVKRRIREINAKGFEASVKDKSLLTVLELANEMLERGFKFQMVSLEKSDAENFIIEGNSLIPPFRAIPGLGNNVAQQIIQARTEAPFISKEDLQKRGKVSKTILEYLDDNGVLQGLPDSDQLTLF